MLLLPPRESLTAVFEALHGSNHVPLTGTDLKLAVLTHRVDIGEMQ